MQRENVWVLQVGGDANLVEESLCADQRCPFGAEEFEGHIAIVFQVVREAHGGHATRAEQEYVAFDGVRKRRRHRSSRCNEPDGVRRAVSPHGRQVVPRNQLTTTFDPDSGVLRKTVWRRSETVQARDSKESTGPGALAKIGSDAQTLSTAVAESSRHDAGHRRRQFPCAP